MPAIDPGAMGSPGAVDPTDAMDPTGVMDPTGAPRTAGERLGLERLWAGGPVAVATRGQGRAPVEVARRLAARWRAPGVALSVVEPPLPFYGLDFQLAAPPVEPEQEEELLGRVRALLRESGVAQPGWPIQVLQGQPAMTVARAARDTEARLLVLGLGRHRPMERLLAGETAVQAACEVDRPLLAVGDEYPTELAAAVVGVDFSPASVVAAQQALALLAPGGTLYLVHVWQPRGSLREAQRRQEEERQRAIPAMLARVERALTVPPGLHVRAYWMEGRPAEALLAFAAEHGAELVAAGRSGQGRWGWSRVGSVTAALLRGASGGVLVVPEPGVADTARIQCHLTGEYTSEAPSQWAEELSAFTRRNRGRRTALQTDEPRRRVHVREDGFTLLGATYDRRDAHVSLMLAAGEGRSHLTRTLDHVRGVSVVGNGVGDAALRIQHGDGETLLTLLPE